MSLVQNDDRMRCDGCRHWERDDDSYAAIRDIGQCTKVVMLWDASEWATENASSTDRVVRPELEKQMSFVADASDYRAELWTKPQFFCAHFEAKDGG